MSEESRGRRDDRDGRGRYPHRCACGSTRRGRLLGTASFLATTRGYALLDTWAESFGQVDKVGMEGTGSFGGLLRFLADYGLTVVEVDRPDRSGRRRNGKSDPLDAESAAQAVQSGRAGGTRRPRGVPAAGLFSHTADVMEDVAKYCENSC